MKNPLKILLLLSILFIGCSKKDEQSYDITYTCYSETGQFSVEYITLDGTWNKVIVHQNTWTKTIKLKENNFSFGTQMKNLSITSTDSTHIIGEYNGKKTESGTRFKNSNSNLIIQISNAR